jgi:hypothetical protein
VPFTLRQHLPLSLQTNLAGLGDSAELLERGLLALGLGVGHCWSKTLNATPQLSHPHIIRYITSIKKLLESYVYTFGVIANIVTTP